EHLEGVPPRSLGFGLLAPATPEPWAAEVEAVARRLHATHYPDPWPITDLFCSLLLADGRRLVALARYGLADHTPGRRRGGLKLNSGPGPVAGAAPAAWPARRWGLALAAVLGLLLAANLWVLWTLPGRLAAERPAADPTAGRDAPRGGNPVKQPPPDGNADR